MPNDTVVVVGQVRTDEYNNLWVTPQGGGDEIKIAQKRENLHPLFEQGKAVMLHWETYKNIPYVSGAKLVEGELPPPTTSDKVLPEHQDEIDEAKASVPVATTSKYKADPTKTKSIERQQALIQAVSWCIAQLQAGKKLKTLDVLVVAKVFESYLESGTTITKPKEPKQGLELEGQNDRSR